MTDLLYKKCVPCEGGIPPLSSSEKFFKTMLPDKINIS